MTCEVRDQWFGYEYHLAAAWALLEQYGLDYTRARYAPLRVEHFLLSNCLAQALLGPFDTQNNKLSSSMAVGSNPWTVLLLSKLRDWPSSHLSLFWPKKCFFCPCTVIFAPLSF